MKERSVPMVIILSLITLGIYYLIWLHQTRQELLDMKAADSLPSPWLVLIPFVGPLIFIWFLWNYAGAVEKATNGKFTQAIAFIMLWLISFIGAGLIQSAFNEVGSGTSNAEPFAEN